MATMRWLHSSRRAAASVCRKAPGKIERLPAIELDQQHRAVQVRGVGNRLGLPERGILGRCARAKGVTLRD
ncbi:hypothetical protein ACVDG5_012240 [Mesorhizobium sp. ORM6]